ncbi:hypothetical protein B0T16DRAFT_401303 [Cercophora newfieldiana]|uniref:Cytochrome c oxidase assembly factor 3 n=1 Tax=Cercophora newfieldiana TaxID=92897 RepID=A0AA39YRF3_9PEZI|nr:hypothetical protein B0T16DRAFT_401303 [Cercophora newfieldiana]
MAGFRHDSYHRENRHSPALIRARRPYIARNALLGAGMFLATAGIYAYTISVVGQDEFSDVKVPDVPIKSPQATTQEVKN